jgi:hypothetical protein
VKRNLLTCRRGHPWTDETLVLRPNGTRTCRACRRMRENKETESASLSAVRLRARTGRFSPYSNVCRNGHLRVTAGVKMRQGYKECRTCLQEREARRGTAPQEVTLASVLADTQSPEVYQLVMECWNEGRRA